MIPLPQEINSAILFQPRENVLHHWQCLIPASGELGYLICTNQRILFVKKKAGIFKTNYEQKLGFNLEGVQTLTVEKSIFSEAKLKLSNYKFIIVRDMKWGIANTMKENELNNIRHIIAETRMKRLEEIEGRTQHIASPKMQEQRMDTVYKEKVIIKEVVKIPCEYCKTLNDQNSQKCSNCGAPL